MKFTLLSAWATLALAGGIYAAPSTAATASVVPVPPAVPAPPAVPSRLAAVGRVQPIGSQIQLSWLPAPRTQAYKVYRDGQFLALSSRAFWTDYGVAAGETHSYTVASLISARGSRPFTPASATVPAGGGSVVYADKLENGWQSWSWAATDLASASPVRSGSAIRVAAGPWQALYLHHAPFNASAYTAVTFWVHGGSTGGQKLCVKALRSGVPQAAVSLDPLPAGKWQSVTISLRDLGVAGALDLDGLWVQDASGTTQPAFSVDEIALTAAPALAPPAAPAGLSATPQWEASCAECGGMAMAHIVLAWNAVAGASSYTVYRYGAKVQDGLTAPNWTDMDATSGKTYAYTVSATGRGGEGPQSVSAAATAPNPPATQAMLTPPTNLAVHGFWQGAPSDVLTWDAISGAASYNVYQYDVLLTKGVTGTSYTLPFNLFNRSMNYTVTAVDGMGMESIPSGISQARGGFDPNNIPNWVNSAVPTAPDNLMTTPEWNNGTPRVLLTWQHGGSPYNVYRDGQKVAGGIWRLLYIDTNVQPGETHTYTVSSVNAWPVVPVEGVQSAPMTGTALAAAPTALLAAKVQITSVTANDDSVVVFFAAVPGAADYRVYDALKPNTVKYSGGGLSIEWNGIDPAAGADLVVEAVDKLGPFQTMDGAMRMDGMAGPGAMQMDGMMDSAINGQGDPSNVPLVLAKSDVFHVTCQPMSLTGNQIFFDNFRGSLPFTPVASLDPAIAALSREITEVENDKWRIRSYDMDTAMSRVFVKDGHFMDTVYDGPTAANYPFSHNNNGSLVMMPKMTADISGGKVLHVTFEVDAHNDGRRWLDVFVGEPGDPLLHPGKFAVDNGGTNFATTGGNLVRWEIQQGHAVQLFHGGTETPLHTPKDWADGQAMARTRWDGVPLANGTVQELDKRHRFDLYLSKTHYRIMETTPDGQNNLVRDEDFPAGVSLPFDKCQVYFVHQVYHTGNDRGELVAYYPAERYWYNNRPYSDERHWDNMGQEVLSQFPTLPSP